jgi:hypothetical protein
VRAFSDRTVDARELNAADTAAVEFGERSRSSAGASAAGAAGAGAGAALGTGCGVGAVAAAGRAAGRLGGSSARKTTSGPRIGVKAGEAPGSTGCSVREHRTRPGSRPMTSMHRGRPEPFRCPPFVTNCPHRRRRIRPGLACCAAIVGNNSTDRSQNLLHRGFRNPGSFGHDLRRSEIAASSQCESARENRCCTLNHYGIAVPRVQWRLRWGDRKRQRPSGVRTPNQLSRT